MLWSMPADVGPVLLLVAAASVILGTVLQRVSGMGVGLVVSPTLALLLGPVAGVLLTNITTTVSAALIAITLWRDIDWRRYLHLAPLIVVGSVPGALLVRAADRSWLEVVIGAALLGTLVFTALVRIPQVGGRWPAAVAGTAGGFLNTAVGVAAPAMLVYAQATGWNQRSFAATLQPIFFTMGATSVITKVGLGAAPISGLPPIGVIGRRSESASDIPATHDASPRGKLPPPRQLFCLGTRGVDFKFRVAKSRPRTFLALRI
jgi:uncharacterized membrane protein YfcA